MMNAQNNIALKNITTARMRALGRAFEKQGHEIRIVGGAVRDTVMGFAPKDIDFATTATPEEMIEVCNHYGLRYIETGLQHGTITILHADDQYEVTTLRADVETNGRHAEVEFIKDWKEDARRRDFTINAMSIDMEGNLYDYFDGYKHAKEGILRFVGDAESRIQEDYLRILRFFRFAKRLRLHNAMFGMSQDEETETLAIIRKNAHGLRQISGERIWMEMSKILDGKSNHTDGETAHDGGYVLDMMREARVFENITPSATFNHRRHYATDEYFLTDPISVLAYGVTHYGYDSMMELINRWKFSKNEREHLMFLWKNAFELVDFKLMAVEHGLELALEIALMQGRQDVYKNLKDWDVPVFPVSGKDLLALGFKPGPRIGTMLHHMKIHWSASQFRATKEELLCLEGSSDGLIV